MKKVKDTLVKLLAMREATVLIIVVFLCAILQIMQPAFLSWSNLKATMLGMISNCFLAMGITMVLASGGMDLSVGSIMGLSGAITAVCFGAGWPMWLSLMFSLAICLCFGLLNGLLAAKTTIAPMIGTLATMQIARGLVMALTTGTTLPIREAPAFFVYLGKGYIGPVPFMIVFAIVTAAVFDFLLRKSATFRQIFYVGSNEQSARLSGINVFKVRMAVYIGCVLFATIAGILSTARFTVASPTNGEGDEMTAIAAAVIGGASTSGGEGTILGAILGVILLALISNALVLLGVSVYWQKLITGFILLTAVLVDYFTHKAKKAR